MELILQERSSKGVVKDYYERPDLSSGYIESPFIHDTLMAMVQADPILFTAISLTVDLATHRGYDFLGENKREVKRANKMFNIDLDFDQVIDNVMWQVLIYGDAYLEVRWNEDKTKVIELHPLESSEMRVNYTENGEILGYKQKVEGKSETKWPSFTTDEVIYFRQYWIGSQVYSYAPFQSISQSFSTRVYGNSYLQSIFRNLTPKMVYFLKSANDKQQKQFIENVIRAKTDPNMDIFAQGEGFDSKLLTPDFDDGLIKVLEYLRKEVLTVTRVPPHWVGIMDGANRGIGENVVIPYETKIKKLQQKIESQVNRELLSKLKISGVKFKFNAITLMNEKTVVEIMNYLKAQGFDSQTIIDYAREHGIDLRDGAFIEEVAEPSNQALMNETAISRHRENKQTDRLTNTIDKKGVSKASGIKLEKNKVI